MGGLLAGNLSSVVGFGQPCCSVINHVWNYKARRFWRHKCLVGLWAGNGPSVVGFGCTQWLVSTACVGRRPNRCAPDIHVLYILYYTCNMHVYMYSTCIPTYTSGSTGPDSSMFHSMCVGANCLVWL